MTLSNGEWHRNMELREQTKLSSRTLAKHLNRMTELQNIEKKTDVKSGKYPFPVFYRATPKLVTYIKSTIARQEITNKIELALNETKDPLMILEAIHASSQLYLIDLLNEIQQNKNITSEQIDFFAECFLWTNYRQYMSKLIQASRKIIDDFNLTQSLINQKKRQIRTSWEELKILEQQHTKQTHQETKNQDTKTTSRRSAPPMPQNRYAQPKNTIPTYTRRAYPIEGKARNF